MQVIWNRKVVDAIFRGGSKHSNAGHTVVNKVRDLVVLIRKMYRSDVPIILRMDSAFLDEENLLVFDQLRIGFICTEKTYGHGKEYVGALPEEGRRVYDNGHQEWEKTEFGYSYDPWKKCYWAIYTRPMYEGEQRLMDFVRPGNIIVTNLGVNGEVVRGCSSSLREEVLEVASIVQSHHRRGADELPHRELKDFGFEELQFKRFSPNTAFFYCMVISFFLFETFKEDILAEVIPVESYASTVGSEALDFSAKIVKTGGEIILKVT